MKFVTALALLTTTEAPNTKVPPENIFKFQTSNAGQQKQAQGEQLVPCVNLADSVTVNLLRAGKAGT